MLTENTMILCWDRCSIAQSATNSFQSQNISRMIRLE